jgi:hypothetical protein
LSVITHGTAGGQRHVRIHRVLGVEIDEISLHFAHLRVFVQVEQFRVVVQHGAVGQHGGVDRLHQIGVRCCQLLHRGVAQARGPLGAAMRAQRGEFVDQVHCRAPENLTESGIIRVSGHLVVTF